MSRLSLSKAWDESVRVVTHDGKLITSVALGLIVLPQVIVGVLNPPSTLSGVNPPAWAGILSLLVAIIGVAGEIAIMRLALGRTSVGEAIAHGARRVLPAFIAILLLVLALTIILIPLILGIAGEEGLKSMATSQPTPATGAAVLLVLVLCLFVAPKFQLVVPTAAAEEGGPIQLLKRGWQLSDGAYWKLLGFLALIVVVAMVVVLFIGQVLVGIVARTMFGTIHPLSLGALVAALLSAIAGALFAAGASVMLARIYVQLAGRSSGT